ncbi:MAG: AraC family transcriptional regulator [Verrucomicrobiota bacterium]
MSDPITCHINRGAYDLPFSGVGIEYDPLGIKPGRSGLTLHETGFLEANSRWNFPGVFSPFWRFYYNASRGHCVLFGDRMVELVPGVVMLIPPHCLIHCLGGNPVPTLWMAFSFTRRLHTDMLPPVLLEARDTELCLIRDLKELIRSNDEGMPTDAIYRNSIALLQVALSRPELRWQPPVPENMTRVIKHIESKLEAKFSGRDLARLAGMSPAGFNRVFRRLFGTSPVQYVTQMRVRKAACLLLQSDETIECIAEKTGFPNRAYFSRVFLRVAGESPAGFRRTHHN